MFLCAKSLQSCPTFGDPMGCSPPVSSVLGTLQARILEWVAMPLSRRSSQPSDQTDVSRISCTDSLALAPPWKPGFVNEMKSDLSSVLCR